MVKGFISPKVPTGYVECCIKGDRIDVEANQYVNTCIFPTSSLKRYFEAKVPGFEAGTYQVGLTGEEHVTLECRGTDGIKGTDDGMPTVNNERENGKFYDLCGRRTENPMSGIYIRNGKKYIIR